MYLLLNGAFGIGKTTVARELRRRLPGAAIVDPEPIGLLLQRFIRTGDFQDIPAWRRWTVRTARLAGRLKPRVIIPMAISSLPYLTEIESGLAPTGRPVHSVVLTARIETVRARLAARGEPLEDPRWSWVHRRAYECCEAHAWPEFGTRVPTDGLSPDEVTRRVMAAIGAG